MGIYRYYHLPLLGGHAAQLAEACLYVAYMVDGVPAEYVVEGLCSSKGVDRAGYKIHYQVIGSGGCGQVLFILVRLRVNGCNPLVEEHDVQG